MNVLINALVPPAEYFIYPFLNYEYVPLENALGSSIADAFDHHRTVVLVQQPLPTNDNVIRVVD